MQAVKDKLHDMSAMRKAKADAKAEEKAEKEIAKTRMDVAHEVRLAKQAEAEMDLHIAKAGERAEREIAMHQCLAENATGATNLSKINLANTTGGLDPHNVVGTAPNYTAGSVAPKNNWM